MMDDAQQSDAAVVARKAANKGARAPAEPLERRAAAERNPRTHRHSPDAESGGGVTRSGADTAVREAEAGERLTALLHHITPEALREAYLALKRDAAPGVDGMTWREYGDGLDERLLDLHGRVHRGAYRAAPVRRVEIPKPDGGMRQLGIASLEDKIVQRAVVEQILNPIYESEFYGFSYGFRPGRSAHNALDALAYAVERRKVNWIVEVDIREFFDSIDREQLMQFLEMRIGDRRVLRLIRKVAERRRHRRGAGGRLRAGDAAGGGDIAAAGERVPAQRARPTGLRASGDRGRSGARRTSCGMPMTSSWGSSTAALRCGSWRGLRERFAASTGWELHPEKTRLLGVRQVRAERTGRKRGEGRPETFDFLGMTHYCRTRRAMGDSGWGASPLRSGCGGR